MKKPIDLKVEFGRKPNIITIGVQSTSPHISHYVSPSRLWLAAFQRNIIDIKVNKIFGRKLSIQRSSQGFPRQRLTRLINEIKVDT
jgi:hypothetical protein